MTGEDSSEEDPRLRDLPVVWWMWMQHEWQERTTLGKLLYPLWFAQAAFAWAIILPLLLFALGMKRLEKAADEPVIPREWVYKDD